MGTRGLICIYYKKKYYIMYNHFDSYFSGIGIELVNFIKQNGFEFIKKHMELKNNSYIEQMDDVSSRYKYMYNYDNSKDLINNIICFTNKIDCEIFIQKPKLDSYIEFIYIINLDENLFNIESNNTKCNLSLDMLDNFDLFIKYNK